MAFQEKKKYIGQICCKHLLLFILDWEHSFGKMYYAHYCIYIDVKNINLLSNVRESCGHFKVTCNFYNAASLCFGSLNYNENMLFYPLLTLKTHMPFASWTKKVTNGLNCLSLNVESWQRRTRPTFKQRKAKPSSYGIFPENSTEMRKRIFWNILVPPP